MPHDLFKNRMAIVGEPAWHRLGVRVPADVSARQMIVAAHLDWEVHKIPAPGALAIDGGKARYSERDRSRDETLYQEQATYDRYLIMRDPVDEEKEPVTLALVGQQYEPLQNIEAFQFFDPFIRNGWASFHTAGALGDGGRVWVLAKLPEPLTIAKNDTVDRYLLLSNSHDGSSAVSVRFTSIRVVCKNTLNLAQSDGKAVVSIRHTRHMRRKLVEAQAEQLKLISDKVFADVQLAFKSMMETNLTATHVDKYLEHLFPRTALQKANGKQPDRWKRVKGLLDRHQPKQSAGTVWALYNAVVRDEDYREAIRERYAQRRLNRIWFGSGHNLKLRALRAARSLLN